MRRAWNGAGPIGRAGLIASAAGGLLALVCVLLWFLVGLSVDSATSPPGAGWNEYRSRESAKPELKSLFAKLDAIEVLLYLSAAVAVAGTAAAIFNCLLTERPKTAPLAAALSCAGIGFAALSVVFLCALKP